ncbi:hypothetical protein Tco_1109591 [Tanacetum coccineum]
MRIPCVSVDKKERRVSLTPRGIPGPSSGVRVKIGDAELILAFVSGGGVAWRHSPVNPGVVRSYECLILSVSPKRNGADKDMESIGSGDSDGDDCMVSNDERGVNDVMKDDGLNCTIGKDGATGVKEMDTNGLFGSSPVTVAKESNNESVNKSNFEELTESGDNSKDKVQGDHMENCQKEVNVCTKSYAHMVKQDESPKNLDYIPTLIIETGHFACSLPTELKDLPSKFNDITEEWELPAEFFAVPSQVKMIQAKLQTLDALPSNLNKVKNALNQFTQAITSNKTGGDSVPSAGQAGTQPTEGEKNTYQATIS